MYNFALKFQTEKNKHMKNIGVKNFRRFEKLDPIELAGITFFVGGNNAGKSTVVKAMRLMLYNLVYNNLEWRFNDRTPISTFRLENDFDSLHIGTFGRVLHKPYPEVKEFEIECQIGSFKFRYIVSGDVKSQRFYADIHFSEIQNEEQTWQISADFNKGILSFNCQESEIANALKRYNKDTEDIHIHKAERTLESEKQNMIAHIDGQLASLYEETKKADDIKKALIEREIRNKETQRFKLLAHSEKKKADNNITTEFHFTSDDVLKAASLLSLTKNLIEREIEIISNVRKTTTSLNTRAKNEELINQYENILFWLRVTPSFLKFRVDSFSLIYIPSHAVRQKVIFSRDEQNDYMSNVIWDFQSNNFAANSMQYLFIQKWMKEFGIGLDFHMQTIQGEALTVTIVNMNGEDVPLADLGMGSIQIFLLLLKLATQIGHTTVSPSIVIIEEPEQNLHPKLQSKLTELFEYVHREYGLRFLIETHSEYMIRKSQAMIATEQVNFEDNPFKVYYFPENGEPYDMEYQKSGMFVNKFDEGFFDEASKQQLSVIKKAREIQHV